MKALPLALLVLPLALAACGRVGPVRAPGPPERIVYPRLYPYVPPVSGTAAPAPDSASPGQGQGSPVPADNLSGQDGVGGLNRPGSPR